MSIHQTKDGRWFVAFREKGSRAVKRKYFGHGPEGKVAAKKFEGNWQSDRLEDKGRAVEEHPSLITFGGLAQKYLEARPLTANSKSSVGYALNRHVLPLWGDLCVTDLTMSHLAQVDELMAKAGKALATRNRVRAYCRAVCQWGLNNDLIPTNPFAKFRPEVKKEGRAPDLVTEQELKSIYEAASPHLQWAIEVMVNTGVRPGGSELLAIKMSDVDYEQGGLWIARGKTRDKHKSLLPLRPEFLSKIKTMAAKDPERIYLIEYDGRQVGSLKKSWGAAKRRAGITRRIRLYELRHWYATNLLSGGADLKAASELMGHSSPGTTLATYYHLLDRQKRSALKHLNVPVLSADDKASTGHFDKPLGKPEKE